jgi:hypothetical protein
MFTIKIDLPYFKKQFFCFFLFLTIPLIAQKRITGVMLDTAKNPISQVSVQLKDINNNNTIAFTYSDTSGAFQLETVNNGVYILQAQYLGLKSHTHQITVTNAFLDLGTIILEVSKIDLENVIIKNEASGMNEIGDTLRYRIEKFLNGTEETLKDVIKKLPGLDIDSQGKIKANGKEVTTLLIDGQEFFMNQHKIATENITAEMIKNIELIKNYTAFKNIHKNNKSEVTALNINIKEKFKNKINGNVSAGFGDNKHKLHSTLFKFTKKTLFSLISDSNNTGELSINLDDYVNFTNKKNEGIVGETTFTNNSDLPRFLLIGNNVKERMSSFNGLNLKYSPTKKTAINFHTLFNDINQVEQLTSTQTYNSAAGIITNNDTQSILEHTFFTSSALDIASKPNDQSLFNYQANFTSTIKNSGTEITNNTNLLSTKNDLYDYQFQQQFNFTTLSNKTTGLNFTLQQEIAKKETLLNINSNATFLDLNFSGADYSIGQKGTIYKNKINFSSNYSLNTSKTENSIFMSAAINKERFDTMEDRFIQFTNNILLTNNTQSIGVNTKFKILNKTSFTSSLSYSRIEWKNNLITDTKYLFTPKMSLKTDFSPNHYLKLTYSRNNSLTTAENLLQNQVITDYRTIISNTNLNATTITPNHQTGLDYFYYNFKKKISIIANASFYKATNIISSNTIATATTNEIQYKIAPFENRLNSLLYTEKTFSSIPFTIKASASYTSSTTTLFYNNESQNLKTEATSSYLSFVSRFKKTSLQFEAGIQTAKETYQDGFTTNYITILNPFFQTSFKISKNSSFITNYAYKSITTATAQNNISQLSPSLRFNFPKSKIELSLVAHDILNIKNYEQTTLTQSDNFTQEKIALSLTGYYLLNIKFKL